MGDVVQMPQRPKPIRWWCMGCGADVTTANDAAITPCAVCGSTMRQSWKPQWPRGPLTFRFNA